MKKIGLFIITLMLTTLCVAQEDDSYVYGDNTSKAKPAAKSGGFDWSRTTIGGGFGMTFGDYTIIEVAPTFGYYITDNILAGIGGSYTYYSDKINNFNTSLYAGRVFGEYLFSELPFLIHAEFEMINIEDLSDRTRLNVYNPYVGGGLKQRIGGVSYFYILVLWNLNETPESYAMQPNPVFRGGIAIGL